VEKVNYIKEFPLVNSQSLRLINQVDAPGDLFTIFEMTPQLQFAHRSQEYSRMVQPKDIFTDHWMLWFGNPPSASVYLKHQGQWIEVSGPSGLFIPPFSMLQWKIHPGNYEWVGFSWELKTSSLPSEAFVFSQNIRNPLNSLEEILQYIQSIEDRHGIIHDDSPSAVSSKAKKYIDSHFKDSKKFEEIAKQLRIPHSTLTHYFKKSFGLSPSEYRKRLRAAESLRLLIGNKQNTTEAYTQSGFQDYSRFFRNIKNTYGRSPTKYSPK
jgi:AraC-like DNA-binding protein